MRLLDANRRSVQSRVWGDYSPVRSMPVAEKTGSSDAWKPMLGADPARLRELGALLRMRRAALGYRHLPAFVAARGINTRMAGDIEHGRRDTYTLPTLKDVAAAYEVTYDSMTAVVWSGAGELVPAAADEPAAPPAAGPRLLPAAPMDDAVRTAADRPYADRIWMALREWDRKGVHDPTGAQLFGAGTQDAEAW